MSTKTENDPYLSPTMLSGYDPVTQGIPDISSDFGNARPSAAVLATCIIDGEERILLGQRLKEANYGKWVLPGGGIDDMESITDAAIREALEEAGAKVEITDRPFSSSTFEEQDNKGAKQAKIIFWLKGKLMNPDEIIGGSDLANPRLFSRAELAELGGISDIVRQTLVDAGWIPKP